MRVNSAKSCLAPNPGYRGGYGTGSSMDYGFRGGRGGYRGRGSYPDKGGYDRGSAGDDEYSTLSGGLYGNSHYVKKEEADGKP